MRMRRGWHTYWKHPGDSGLPPRVEWSLPAGWSAGPIKWPVPERMREGPLVSYGYAREVLLPIEITPPASVTADAITIAGRFEWLECADVCIAGAAALDLTLPVSAGPPMPGAAQPLFTAARARMPSLPVGWSFVAVGGPRAIDLSFRPPPGHSPRGGYLFVDQPLVADHSAPQGFEVTPDGYRLTLAPAPSATRPPERLTGVLVLEDRAGRRGRTAVAIDVALGRGDPAPAREQRGRRMLPAGAYAAGAAVLGLGVAGILVAARRSRRRAGASGGNRVA